MSPQAKMIRGSRPYKVRNLGMGERIIRVPKETKEGWYIPRINLAGEIVYTPVENKVLRGN
jgi:hypothetical protein